MLLRDQAGDYRGGTFQSEQYGSYKYNKAVNNFQHCYQPCDLEGNTLQDSIDYIQRVCYAGKQKFLESFSWGQLFQKKNLISFHIGKHNMFAT